MLSGNDKGVGGELILLKGGSKAPTEAGKNWEISMFGKVIERDAEGEGPQSIPASKFLKAYKNGITNKFEFGSPFDVTKGIAPTSTSSPKPKKPDGFRPPRTHKPKERKAGQ